MAGRSWETHLVPQGHLPVVPSGCACGQQLLQVPQKQHFAGPVPLVAGFLEEHVQSGIPLPLLTLVLHLECLPGSPQLFLEDPSRVIFQSYKKRQTSAQLHALIERLLSTHYMQGMGLGRITFTWVISFNLPRGRTNCCPLLEMRKQRLGHLKVLD